MGRLLGGTLAVVGVVGALVLGALLVIRGAVSLYTWRAQETQREQRAVLFTGVVAIAVAVLEVIATFTSDAIRYGTIGGAVVLIVAHLVVTRLLIPRLEAREIERTPTR